MAEWVSDALDCYNADRHIAVRLGRNAVLQQTMTSRWWEDLSDHVHRQDRKGSNDVWTSDLFMLACIAQVGSSRLLALMTTAYGHCAGTPLHTQGRDS